MVQPAVRFCTPSLRFCPQTHTRVTAAQLFLVTVAVAIVGVGGVGSATVPHPRLRFTDADVHRLKALLSSDSSHLSLEIFVNLTRHADVLLATPAPNASTAPGLLCDTIRDHTYTLGLLYRSAEPHPPLSPHPTPTHRVCNQCAGALLERPLPPLVAPYVRPTCAPCGDTPDANSPVRHLPHRLSSNPARRASLAARAAAEMVAVSQLDSWVPRRYLTVAETMHGVAIGYDWFCKETLPPPSLPPLPPSGWLCQAHSRSLARWHHAHAHADDALSLADRTVIEDGLVRNGLAVGNNCWHQNCTWVPGIAGVGACTSCWWTR